MSEKNTEELELHWNVQIQQNIDKVSSCDLASILSCDNKQKENFELWKFYDTNVWIRNEENLSGSRPTVRKWFYELLWNIEWKYILDVWCGTWIDSKFFAESWASWIWLDISKESLKVANRLLKWNENRKFLNENFMEFDEKWIFDIIVFSMWIMHYKEMEPIFAKLSTLLKPGGKVLLTTNNPFLVCKDFFVKYPKDWEDIEYIHMLWEHRDIAVTKYVHPIWNYVYNANNQWLSLSLCQKQAVYGPETSAFNNPTPEDPTIPNFIAFLYIKDWENNFLENEDIKSIADRIETFIKMPLKKWNYSREILKI